MNSASFVLLRPAEIGDVGVVIGYSQDSDSGLASLEIEIETGAIVTVDGDWRMIAHIHDDLEGECAPVKWTKR